MTINTINYIFVIIIIINYKVHYNMHANTHTTQLLSARYDFNSYTFLIYAKYACPHLDLANMIFSATVTWILHHKTNFSNRPYVYHKINQNIWFFISICTASYCNAINCEPNQLQIWIILIKIHRINVSAIVGWIKFI